jgi:hypothetical protein
VRERRRATARGREDVEKTECARATAKRSRNVRERRKAEKSASDVGKEKFLRLYCAMDGGLKLDYGLWCVCMCVFGDGCVFPFCTKVVFILMWLNNFEQ